MNPCKVETGYLVSLGVSFTIMYTAALTLIYWRMKKSIKDAGGFREVIIYRGAR